VGRYRCIDECGLSLVVHPTYEDDVEDQPMLLPDA
jgi:hypothetical protein